MNKDLVKRISKNFIDVIEDLEKELKVAERELDIKKGEVIYLEMALKQKKEELEEWMPPSTITE